MIEYAVILFKKQKLSKFGAPGQSAYEPTYAPSQTQPALSSYMSLRGHNRDAKPTNGVNNPNSTAHGRQKKQQPVFPDWHQGGFIYFEEV